jgi:hypothetical protein
MGFGDDWLMEYSYKTACNGLQHVRNSNTSHFCPIASPAYTAIFAGVKTVP